MFTGVKEDFLQKWIAIFIWIEVENFARKNFHMRFSGDGICSFYDLNHVLVQLK